MLHNREAADAPEAKQKAWKNRNSFKVHSSTAQPAALLYQILELFKPNKLKTSCYKSHNMKTWAVKLPSTYFIMVGGYAFLWKLIPPNPFNNFTVQYFLSKNVMLCSKILCVCYSTFQRLILLSALLWINLVLPKTSGIVKNKNGQSHIENTGK